MIRASVTEIIEGSRLSGWERRGTPAPIDAIVNWLGRIPTVPH